MRAAWYGRVSSLDQVEDGSSLTTQQEKCEAEIQRRGWELSGSYVDAGISGAKLDRPEWQRLLADCRAGKVGAVVVTALDRMARNARHAIEITDDLDRLGVVVVVLRENLDLSTPAGRMVRTMLAGVAEMERDLIRERSIAGQRAKSARSLWPGGKPSYGWRLDGAGKEAKPVPDPEEREIIVMVADWVTREGASTGLVAKRLNELGVRTRSGAPWSYAVVRRILSNPALVTGEHHWGLVGLDANGRYHKTQNKNGKPAHGEPVMIRMPDPPMTPERFAEVQAALGRHPRANVKQPEEATQMLSGRLFGECGSHQLGVRIKGKDYDLYRCEGRRRPKPGEVRCSCRQIHVAKLDERVWADVVAVLGDRDRLQALAKEWLAVGTAEDPTSVETVARKLAEQLKRLERAIERAKEAWLFADDAEEARATLARLRSQREQVKRKLDAAQVVDPGAKANAERLTDLAALADRAGERLRTMGPAERRELVTLLQLEVHLTGPVVGAEPESYEVRGMLDPRPPRSQ
ncbi:recombinase family protein [Arthrobacter pigmenti]